ncbi:hypothetical protein L1N85_11500 [Paenibacillus alkaliterrae]|uniref:hypothetical protein n=1 Tax=Paenibacillus alkaliterrae TaxID=320909 RepID=UPI001F19A7ED|nr:hypothetical protein [Paenibacillus alkaliterrae]MCF2939060.1 hypothetical protein [Paenibacillus alkaliterrae]
MGNKIVKSVSLNISNADDAAILKAIKRRNFSGYVKRLILADIKAREAETAVKNNFEPSEEQTPALEPEKSLSAAERLEALKRQKGESKPAQAKPWVNQPKS